MSCTWSIDTKPNSFENSTKQVKANMKKKKKMLKRKEKPLRRLLRPLPKQLIERSDTENRAPAETNLVNLEYISTILNPDENDNKPDKKSIIIHDDDEEPHAKPKTLCVDEDTPKKLKLDDLILLKSNFVVETKNHTNTDSFLTIDLTKVPVRVKKERVETTDMDVDSTDDVILVSNENNAGVKQDQSKKITTLSKITQGIANLNEIEKGQLVEMIAEVISDKSNAQLNVQKQTKFPRRKDTPGASTDSNIYHPNRQPKQIGLRMVVIDGSNVAMQYSNGKFFSVEGLNMSIDFFMNRGHVVKAFVPKFRNKLRMSSNSDLLDDLEKKGLVIYTPARVISHNTSVVPYDDRYIVQCAVEFDAVIVSQDRFYDIMHENPKWRIFLKARQLRFDWIEKEEVKNEEIIKRLEFTVPDHPRGENGPTLDEFLKHTSPIQDEVIDKDYETLSMSSSMTSTEDFISIKIRRPKGKKYS